MAKEEVVYIINYIPLVYLQVWVPGYLRPIDKQLDYIIYSNSYSLVVNLVPAALTLKVKTKVC